MASTSMPLSICAGTVRLWDSRGWCCVRIFSRNAAEPGPCSVGVTYDHPPSHIVRCRMKVSLHYLFLHYVVVKLIGESTCLALVLLPKA